MLYEHNKKYNAVTVIAENREGKYYSKYFVYLSSLDSEFKKMKDRRSF